MKRTLFFITPCIVYSISLAAAPLDKVAISPLSDSESAYTVNSFSLPYHREWMDSSNNTHIMVSDQPISEEIMLSVTQESLSKNLANSAKVLTVNGEAPLEVKLPAHDLIYTVRKSLTNCHTAKLISDDNKNYYPLDKLTGDLCPKNAMVDLNYIIKAYRADNANSSNVDANNADAKIVEVDLVQGIVYLADSLNYGAEKVHPYTDHMTVEWVAPLLGSFKSEITLSGVDSDKIHVDKYYPHNTDIPVTDFPSFYNTSVRVNDTHFVYLFDSNPEKDLWAWSLNHQWSWGNAKTTSPYYLNTTYLQQEAIAYSGFTPNTMVQYRIDSGDKITLHLNTEVSPMALFGYWLSGIMGNYASYFGGEKEPTGGKGYDLFPYVDNTDITIDLSTPVFSR